MTVLGPVKQGPCLSMFSLLSLLLSGGLLPNEGQLALHHHQLHVHVLCTAQIPAQTSASLEALIGQHPHRSMGTTCSWHAGQSSSTPKLPSAWESPAHGHACRPMSGLKPNDPDG